MLKKDKEDYLIVFAPPTLSADRFFCVIPCSLSGADVLGT